MDLDDKEVQKRSIMLLAGATVITLILVGLVLWLLPGENDEDEVTTFSVAAADKPLIEEAAKNFLTASGNFGVPGDEVNLGLLNGFLVNYASIAETTVSRTENNQALQELLARSPLVGREPVTEETPEIIFSVTAQNPTASVPNEGFLGVAGARSVVVPVTFDCRQTVYALPQESAEPVLPNQLTQDWDSLSSTYDVKGEIVLQQEGADWKVYDVRNVSEPECLSINSGPFPYNPEIIEKVQK